MSKTKRVLAYVAEHPAASNKEVAEALGDGLTANAVSQIKSLHKAKMNAAKPVPVDLAAVRAAAPAIREFGGTSEVRKAIAQLNELSSRLTAGFGNVERALEICYLYDDIMAVMTPEAAPAPVVDVPAVNTVEVAPVAEVAPVEETAEVTENKGKRRSKAA